MTQLEALSKKLKHRLSLPLPGLEAQLRMAHAERRNNFVHFKIPDDAKVGAVLILLFEEDMEIKTVLIQRPTYEGVHSAQVAFPGGKQEPGETPEQAALREANEELNITSADVQLLGRLTSLYIPPSRFLVHPFVGSINYSPSFIPHEREVEEVIKITLDDLLDPSIISEKEVTLNNGLLAKTPFYNISGKNVWGATAMIISEFGQIMTEI